VSVGWSPSGKRLGGLFLYSIQATTASAAASERVRAAARTFVETQSGNGTSSVTWCPALGVNLTQLREVH